jgi:uncharacterized protein (TIGR02246 family)
MATMLTDWKRAFDTHNLDEMAALFTEDARFQGFAPRVLSGRAEVRAYYEAVPAGRVAEFEVLSEYEMAAGVFGGFVAVTFSDPTGWNVAVHMSLVVQTIRGVPRIRQYHVSILTL